MGCKGVSGSGSVGVWECEVRGVRCMYDVSGGCGDDRG